MVLTDYLNRYVSKQGARDDYGVVIDDRDQIDLAATEALRQKMRAEAKAAPGGRALMLIANPVRTALAPASVPRRRRAGFAHRRDRDRS